MELQQTQIIIQDDFDLEKITSCGQCFRVRKFDDETYRFIIGHHILYIRHLKGDQYLVSCTPAEWHEIWQKYFDLTRNYKSLRMSSGSRNEFICKAMEYGCGLRVLRQDPWEMLITFIISQRKNIPAISKSVEKLSEKYGTPVSTARETVCLFPTPEQLSFASIEALAECQLGYRAAYVRDAVDKVLSGTLDLKAIAGYEDERLFQELLQVHGVGKKVANCVCLFGYGRSAMVPVDIWISRVIQEEYKGQNPFPLFGEDAGIMQQYAFYYEKNFRFRMDEAARWPAES